MKPIACLFALPFLLATPLALAESPAINDVVAQTQGDLDGDGIAEYVEIRNTAANSELDGNGFQRALFVYKVKNGQKTLWQRSDTAVYASNAGGMMGDPFEDLSIKKGSLFLTQSGGSSWKWGFTDQYRFQNGQFELIGYQSTSGRLCDSWEFVDANLSTGKIVYRKEFDHDKECGNDENKGKKDIKETFVNKKIALNFANRNTQEVKIIAPKSKEAIYMATPSS